MFFLCLLNKFDSFNGVIVFLSQISLVFGDKFCDVLMNSCKLMKPCLFTQMSINVIMYRFFVDTAL